MYLLLLKGLVPVLCLNHSKYASYLESLFGTLLSSFLALSSAISNIQPLFIKSMFFNWKTAVIATGKASDLEKPENSSN